MGMSRCYSLMKCLLIIFSIIFLCVGGGACGLAGWALWEGRGSESPSGRAALCALAAWGGTLALGALLALWGAWRGSGAALAGALALLALAGAAEGAAVCWGAAHRPQLHRALTDALHHSVLNEYGRVAARTQLLDVIQQELQCCGADGPRDWQHSWWSRAQTDGADVAEAEAETGALDLSVSAAGARYWAPASCCVRACDAGGVMAGAGATPGTIYVGGCGLRALAALAGMARGPLALGGALLALHALALPLTLALWLRAHPAPAYKA